MKLLRSFPTLAFSLILLSMAAVCMVQRSVGMLVVAGTLAAISWYITEGPRGRSLPRWVSNILVIGFSLWVLVDALQNVQDLLGVLGRYAVLLTLVKLYERRSVRDYAQLLTLSLLLMLTACLQSNDLIFGAMLLVYAVLGLYVLLLYQIFAAFEREQRGRQAIIPADYRLIPPLKPVTGPNVGWSFRAQSLGIALAGIAVSIVVFLGFPRGYGAGMLGMMRIPPAARTSQFSSTIDLNLGGRITESRERVLTMQLLDGASQPVRPDNPILLRGAVLDYYAGTGQWTTLNRPRSRERRFEREPDPSPLTGEPIDNDVLLFTQRIVLAAPSSGVMPVFSMYAPVAVQGDSFGAIVYEPTTQIMRTEPSARRVVMYTVEAIPSPPDSALAELATPVQPTTRMNWFSPEDRAALIELADGQLRNAGIPVDPPAERAERWTWNEQVATVLSQFLHAAPFIYTTDLSSIVYKDANDDPIVRFLTDSRRGHCEFFACGLASLCHVKGLPARVVVGYVAYDYDEALQQYNVLARNAHAWTEIAIGPNRWQTYDPTPPASLLTLHTSTTTIADQMRWMYQRFEGNWSASVVDFNQSAQAQLADTINRGWAGRLAGFMDAVGASMDRVNRFFSLGPAGYIWMGTVGLAIVIATIALLKLMKRSLAIRRTLRLNHVRGAEYQRMVRQLGFYLDMLRVLDRAGISKPSWQPPLQFAVILGRRNREAADLVREITEAFYEVRYGRQPLDGDSLRAARHMVGQLAASLRVRA